MSKKRLLQRLRSGPALPSPRGPLLPRLSALVFNPWRPDRPLTLISCYVCVKVSNNKQSTTLFIACKSISMALYAFRVYFLLFGSYRKAKFSTNEYMKICHFDSKISKIFWGTPHPVERGTPPPHTLPPRRLRLDSAALLCSAPPIVIC